MGTRLGLVEFQWLCAAAAAPDPLTIAALAVHEDLTHKKVQCSSFMKYCTTACANKIKFYFPVFSSFRRLVFAARDHQGTATTTTTFGDGERYEYFSRILAFALERSSSSFSAGSAELKCEKCAEYLNLGILHTLEVFFPAVILAISFCLHLLPLFDGLKMVIHVCC